MRLDVLEKRINKLESASSIGKLLHVEQLPYYSMKIGYGKNEQTYIPSKTGIDFHKCEDDVRLVLGPYGSGKSTTCCKDLVDQAIKMPRYKKDGVRRSRFAIVRNTTGDLETTTLKTWLEWFGDLGAIESHKKPVMTYIHSFNDKYGRVELELIFLAMDRPKDIRKLKSLELTGAYLNEASELPDVILSHIKARINRFPRKSDIAGEYNGKIILDTNPPSTDHWIYKLFEEKRPDGHKIFKQPPGLIKDDDGSWMMNPNADNIIHLSDKNYYMNFSRGQTEEFIKVFCLGEYGILMSGKKVHPNYNDDLHSVDSLEFDVDSPLYLGWDFGLTPACLISQFISGQRRDIKEFTTTRMGIRELAEQIVKPFLTESCEGMTVISRGDPAGGDGKDALHDMSILNDVGIPTQPARTNKIGPRVDATNFFLSRISEGKPSYMLSREGCPQLRKGFLGKYRFKRLAVVGEERYRDEPEKLHPYSDIQDCGQYISLEMVGEKTKQDYDFSEFSYNTLAMG